MKLIESHSKKEIEGEISRISLKELKKLKKNKDFSFDWSLESDNQVFKITIKEQEEILGIASIIDFPEEFRIHINLIEASKLHRGKQKPIQNIIGCLIAYICQISFKRGYEGFVSLTPKTKLVDYYRNNYGFQQMGTQMAVYYEISNSLILKYIGDEKI